MGIVIENDFDVAATPDDTYALMTDVERVAPCIPGATITGKREDGAYDALVTMKMGPMSLTYKGVIEIVEQDDAAKTAVMRAKATEAKGQGTAQATLTMNISDAGDGKTNVKVGSDILVTGRVAQMGRGIMTDVAGKMVGEMAKAMEATLVAGAEAKARGEAPPESVAAEAPSAVGIAADITKGKIKGLFGGNKD
ncbi:MAG: SRPBCC family protein [Actinobacteria bacterium]|nr:SRPBCC family protein [Actinomycetota bacterium]